MTIFGTFQRHQKTKILLTSILGILLLAVGCSAADTVTPYTSDGTLDNNDTTPTELYAYAGSTDIGAGGYTYIYAQGGTSPYTYTVTQGDATINNTSGYLQALSQGAVAVRVQDASGASYTVSFDIGAGTTTGTACLYLGEKTQQASGATQSRIDLPSHTELAKHVITGLGVRFQANSLIGIYAKVAQFNADATISTSSVYTYRTGDLGNTTKGEIYIDLPAGYFLTGVGVATDATGENAEALKLFGAKLTSAGVLVNTVECLVDKDTQSCTIASNSMSAKSYYARYSEYRSTHSKPLVTWGAKIASAKVTSTDIATKTVTASTTDTGLCPQ